MRRITHQDVYTYLSSARNMKKFIERCDFYILLDFNDRVSLHLKEIEEQVMTTATEVENHGS